MIDTNYQINPSPDSNSNNNNNDLIQIDPTHHLTFGQPPEIQSIAFHPDGQRAFVHMHGESVNAWSVAVYLWPEIIGFLTLLVIVIAYKFIMHIVHNPRQTDHYYCRSCNYDVTDKVKTLDSPINEVVDDDDNDNDNENDPNRCPECGLDITKKTPIPGRTKTQRLGPVLIIATLFISPYIALWGNNVPRHNNLSHWLNWPSEKLLNLSSQPQYSWLQKFVQNGDIVRELNLQTGQWNRTVCARSSNTYFNMTLSPSGDHLYLESPNRAGIDRINTKTGRTTLTLQLPNQTRYPLNSPVVLHRADNQEVVWVYGLNMKTQENILWRWDLQSNSYNKLIVETAYQYQPGFSIEREYRPINDGPDTGTWLSIPTFMEAFNSKTYKLRVFDSKGVQLREIDLGQIINSTSVAEVIPQGRYAYVTNNLGNAIQRVDLSGIEPVALLRGDVADFGDNISIHPSGRFLFVTSINDGVTVRDMEQAKWITKLNFPPGLFGPQITISPDGNWLAAILQRNATPPEAARGVKYSHDLVIWNVQDIVNEK